MVQTTSIATHDLVFGRMFFAALLGFAYLYLFGETSELKKIEFRSFLPIALTSGSIFLNMVFLYRSFRLASPSLCVAIFFCGPVFTILFRALFLGQSMTRLEKGLCLLVGLLIGGFFLSSITGNFGASFGPDEIWGYFYALLGGVLFGLIPIFEVQTSQWSPVTNLTLQATVASLALAPFIAGSPRELFTVSLIPILTLAVFFYLYPFSLMVEGYPS